MSSANGMGDTSMKFSGVFKSLEAIKNCLQSDRYHNLPEVQQLLKIFSENYSNTQEKLLERSQHKVFIVLEGIDASGKTTISKRLAKLISGTQLSTPPQAILGLREQFDAHETELRRAYYSLGNYIAAQEVQNIYKTTPVIMDRYWHSTAAYAIAQEANNSVAVPPEGDAVYEWPTDLLKPDIVFFLSVSESKRLDRLMRRKNKPITREELKLKDDKPFREAVAQVFQLLKNPGVSFINANLFPKKVVDACIRTLAARKLIDQVPKPKFNQTGNSATTLEKEFEKKTKLN